MTGILDFGAWTDYFADVLFPSLKIKQAYSWPDKELWCCNVGLGGGGGGGGRLELFVWE